MSEAGLLADNATRRGRKNFHMDDCIREKGSRTCGNPFADPQQRTPSPFCRAPASDAILTMNADKAHLQCPAKGEYCGLSSMELSQVFNQASDRRGRRHIYHGTSACQRKEEHVAKTPSIVSELFSEDSAIYHLGHREHIVENWEQSLHDAHEAAGWVPDYDTAGLNSHYINAKKGRLGYGKRKYGPECKWVGYHHHAARVDGFGGEERKHVTKGGGHHEDQKDHIFDNQIPDSKERHTRKMFDKADLLESYGKPDLDTKGFLGKSKGRADGATAHISCDPISDRSSDPKDHGDIACYGLNQRGKRKFLVQTNLETGCRHNMSQSEITTVPTLRSSASEPVLNLPTNQTPYYQDDLPESARALKNELPHSCNLQTQLARDSSSKFKVHATKVVPDTTWDVFGSWTPRGCDHDTAARFVDGDNVPAIEDAEYRDACREHEFRSSLGHTKRNFGNAHNKSSYRFDHNDEPGYKSEFVCVTSTKHPVTDEFESALIRWGKGHGRKKFDVEDHFVSTGGNDPYMQLDGQKMPLRSKSVPKHMQPKGERDPNCVLDLDGNAISFKSRSHKVMNDTLYSGRVFDHMNDEAVSDHSDTLALVGRPRNSERIRPQSARRFPQKDFEKVTPRSLTPRPRSEVSIPLTARPLWKK